MKHREPLIEERYVDSPLKFAQEIQEEALRIFSSSGWKSHRAGYLEHLESAPVSGPFARLRVRITRGCTTAKYPAEKLFQLLTSPEGFAVLDPVSRESDHNNPPLESYIKTQKMKVEAAITVAPIPLLKPAEFVVFNATNYKDLIFVSKSILHQSRPGGSRCSSAGKPPGGMHRAINTFALKVEEVDRGISRVHLINYLHPGYKAPPLVYNIVNLIYLRRLLGKIRKLEHLEENQLSSSI
jgi:hypothetical protein